ncbi:MAG: family 10 glycosylhydrolase [Bacteroidota bacterium]
MNKREFLRTLGLGGAALAARGLVPSVSSLFAGTSEKKKKYWAWLSTDPSPSPEEWKRRFALMRASGLNAVLPEIYNSRQAYYQSQHLPVAEQWLEKILPLAKAEGLEVHSWMWSVPCNIEQVRTSHPEWFCVDRNGDSILDKTPYVPWYRFMCPSHPGVHEFIRTTVEELCGYPALDGIHFDYIRYPDVILPVRLQPKYGLTQDREEPQFDYCYCDLCRDDFLKQSGTDIRTVTDPPSNGEWRQFRYDRITHLVNDTLIPVVHAHKKIASAAVFPNWEMVRQEWSVWNLDAVLPMLYHRFYDGGIDWIGAQTKKGVESLQGRVPLYSGLMVPQLRLEELPLAIETSLSNGAQGVVLFTAQSMTEEHWKVFSRAIAQ